MAKAYWKTVAIGDLIPSLIKSSISRVDFAKFAGATKDYSPLHLDDEHARSCGYGGSFAQGNLVLGVIEEALYNYAENARITHMVGTFHKLVWPGDMLTAKALISDKYEHNNEFRIDLEIWIENQYHDVVSKGQATLLLFKDPEEENPRNPIPRLSPDSVRDLTQSIRAKIAKLSLTKEEEIKQAESRAANPKKSSKRKTTTK